MDLALLEEDLAVCRLQPGDEAPAWTTLGALTSVTRTPAELSVICGSAFVPDDVSAERGWRALVVTTPLDFSTTGVAAAVTTALAVAGVPVLPLATHDTDYFLVKGDRVADAIEALLAAGHRVTA
jgi:uncharacterized protein